MGIREIMSRNAKEYFSGELFRQVKEGDLETNILHRIPENGSIQKEEIVSKFMELYNAPEGEAIVIVEEALSALAEKKLALKNEDGAWVRN